MNILIVDDEKYILEEIRYLLSPFSESHHIQSTSDALEAQYIISHAPIEILITDIRMSNVDGIKLATQLKVMNPHAHIIFISAYDDKEYLKAAIHLQVDGYFEKPLNHHTFLAYVSEFIQEYEVNTLSDFDSRMQKMQESFKKLLASNDPLNFINTSYIPVVFKISKINCTVHCDKYILKLLDEHTSLYSNINFLLNMHQSTSFSLIFYGTITNQEVIYSILKNIVAAAEDNVQFLISLGDLCYDFHSLKENYIHTAACLEYDFYDTYGIKKATINEHGESASFSISRELSHFTELLSHNDMQKIMDYTMQLFTRIKTTAALPSTNAKHLFHQLLSTLYFFAEEHSMIFDLSLDEIMHLDFCLFSEYEQYFLQQLNLFFEDYTQNNSTVQKIKAYIMSHYHEPDLSIKSIAQALSLNNAYMCTNFKKITGITINDYLTSYRIKKSQKLILQDTLNINEIAYKVGYNDPNYFSRIFKKCTGMTASEFKKTH